MASPVAQRVKNPQRRGRFDSWVGKFPWRKNWQPAPVFLLEKSHGHRSLVGYSSWGCKESDTTAPFMAEGQVGELWDDN